MGRSVAAREIRPDTLADIEQYVDDFELFASDCLYVKDHNTAQVVKMVLNPGQKILDACAKKQLQEKGCVRIMLLKTRRFGGSTYIEARYYWKTSLNFYRNTFIIGHELDSTDTLYQMATLFHQQNPLKPQTRKSNAKELVFDTDTGDGLKSEYRLATARNLAAGRSQGIHYLHDSEEAYWLNADTLLPSLLACLPPLPMETEAFRESTANGFGNRFQIDCFKAYAEGKFPFYKQDGITFAWSNPETEWIIVFVPWFVHPQYAKAFRSEKERAEFEAKIKQKVLNPDTMAWEDAEAVKLQKRYNLKLDQLYWRDWAIENICNGSVDKFHQEYPSTVEEAFLSSGSNVFGKELCDVLESQCCDPIVVGDVVDVMGQSKIRPNRFGSFSLWEKPIPGQPYFITIDPGGGIKESQIEEKREPDPTCIDVWNHTTGIQAAQWHGHIDYDMIDDMVLMVGKMFAIKDRREEIEYLPPACVELLNHGYTVVSNLRKKNYPMYEAKANEPGWIPNAKTKPVAIDSLYELTRDTALQLRSVQTVSEMRTFINKGGKMAAESGCHDDRVMSAAMGAEMMKLLPRYIRSKRQDDGVRLGGTKRNNQDDGSYREVRI